MGLGGDDSWGAWPHDPYLIRPDQTYLVAFRLRPLAGGDDPAVVGRQVLCESTGETFAFYQGGSECEPWLLDCDTRPGDCTQ